VTKRMTAAFHVLEAGKFDGLQSAHGKPSH
jgi:hypothetical protein